MNDINMEWGEMVRQLRREWGNVLWRLTMAAIVVMAIAMSGAWRQVDGSITWLAEVLVGSYVAFRGIQP